MSSDIARINSIVKLFVDTCKSEGTSSTEVITNIIHFFRDYQDNHDDTAVNAVKAEDRIPSGITRDVMIRSVSVQGSSRFVSQNKLYVEMNAMLPW